MRADLALFAGLSLSHAERKHCIERAYRNSLDHRIERLQMPLVRLNQTKMQFERKCKCKCAKSFQLRPMRERILWGRPRKNLPTVELAKKVKCAFEIVPENGILLSDARR